jgi:hypothetical protein
VSFILEMIRDDLAAFGDVGEALEMKLLPSICQALDGPQAKPTVHLVDAHEHSIDHSFG